MHKTFTPLGLTCILVGGLLILENYGLIPSISMWWPLFPFLVGLGMVRLFNDRGQQDLTLIGMATYLIAVSLFFFYLNWTNWIQLKELWPVFVGLLGLSFLAVFYFSRGKGSGRKLIIVLSIFLMILSLLLFIIFKVDARLWPLALVLFGISIILILLGDQT
ncbi:hypothetical protein JXQ70_15700 [bacterium]|nr:hypothetical protein [bacterium]